MTSRSNSKAERVTLETVAMKAGVGIATVDRVVNERENVSAATRRKVLDVARELGLRRILPESEYRSARIEVLLPRPELPLISRMNDEFRRLGRRLDRMITIHRTILKDEEPETLAAALHRTKCDGLIVYAQDHPAINDAIAALNSRGVRVVTMISDLPEARRVAYAGIDHYRAGRTAGAFMNRMTTGQGEVIVLCNHMGFESHASRTNGFADYLAEHAPRLRLTEVVECRDDRSLAEVRLRDAFQQHPSTLGVYNVGAANLGVAAAIMSDMLENRPVFIGHELTPFSAQLLKDGIMMLAIDQAPEQQSQFALDVLLNELGFASAPEIDPAYRSNVPILLYSAENIPPGFSGLKTKSDTKV